VFEIDHVIYAVTNLQTAAADFEQRYGLVTVKGGVHPGGTANYTAALRNSQYIELLGVHDEAAVRGDPFGRTLVQRLELGDGLLAWALRTDALDAFAARVGVQPESGSIVDDDGRTGSWRTVEAPDDANGALPFLITYGGDPALSGAEWDQEFKEASHPSGATHINWVEVAVDEERLSGWLGDHGDLPIHVVADEDGLRAVALATPTGEVVIR
jgi:hypothetical protein